MTTAPLRPADHAFVAALTSLSLMIVRSAKDEAFYIDAADKVLDQVNRSEPVMQKLFIAFVHLKASSGVLGESASARVDLDMVLLEFHRLRLARAFGALEAANG